MESGKAKLYEIETRMVVGGWGQKESSGEQGWGLSDGQHRPAPRPLPRHLPAGA